MAETRYLFMNMPDEQTAPAMQAVVKRTGLDTLLGSALFKPINWHQSLSDRYWPDETPVLLFESPKAQTPQYLSILGRWA